MATLTELITARLGALDYDGLAALYRADVLLDVSVPQWRFQLKGRETVRAWLHEELDGMAGRARVSACRPTPTEDGLVVELEVRFTANAGEGRWREVHLFSTDGAAITRHANYCTGVWDAATIARHAVEAPMVER